jgi:flagellin
MVTAGNEDLLVKTNELSAFSVDELTTMIQNAATARAENGAQSQRLNWSSDMLALNYTNVEAAHSRLSDVDFATESTRFAKNNILLQSAAAMLSQANSLPSVALQLLQ